MEIMEKLDFSKFEGKLGKWAGKFRPFIEGKQMWDIYQRLKADGIKEIIVPEASNTFRAFETTDPKVLKVVFYLMDPYPRKYKEGGFQATGIAMDCSNSPDGKIQPSLVQWYNAISRSEGKKVEYSPSLSYLHEQGVMLLNTDLTCKLNKTASHEKLWEPFQKYFLEEVVGSDAGIIYVLCGQASKRMKRYINPFAKVIELSHPASASHKGTEWDDEGTFKLINKILYDNHGPQGLVLWDKAMWLEYQELPF